MTSVCFAEYIVSRLAARGIDYVFGVPGSYIMPLWQRCIGGQVPMAITARHESGAAYMAGGYARIKHCLGVVLTTIGPGVTHVMTGIAEAYRESIPLLFISGQSACDTFGRGAFQESSGLGRSFHPTQLLAPICKQSLEITRMDQAIEAFETLFALATDQRPGPVHLSIPIDVQNAPLFSQTRLNVKPYKSPVALPPPVEPMVDRIRSAKRPLMLVGWGCGLARCSALLNMLSSRCKIPLLTTVKGLYAIDHTFPYFIGHIGPGGNAHTLTFLYTFRPDYILVLGSSLSCYAVKAIAPLLEHAHVDQIDQDETLKRHRSPYTDQLILSEIGLLLRRLTEALKRYPPLPVMDGRCSLIERTRHTLYRYPKPSCARAFMGEAVTHLNHLLPKNTIVMPDAGNHWLNTFSLYQPKCEGNLVANTSLGTMGYAIGCCIGMQLASQDRRVVCITGDASVLMSGNEMTVAKEWQLNLLFIVFNNACHGRIRTAQQQNFKHRTHATDITPVDFAMWARSYGIQAMVADDIKTFDQAVQQALHLDTLCLIDVRVDKDEVPVCLSESQLTLTSEILTNARDAREKKGICHV